MEHTTKERGSNSSVSLQITYPAHKRLATPLGSTSPTLFKQWCGFFYLPKKNQIGESAVRQELWFFCPYLRRLERLTICRSHCQGSTFSSVILKTLSVGPAGVLNPRPPTQQTDTLSTELTRQRSNDNKLQDKLTAQDPQVFAIPILSSQF